MFGEVSTAGGETHLGLIFLPAGTGHQVDGVAIGVDQDHGIATVGQTIADATVIDEGGNGEAGGGAAAEEEDPTEGKDRSSLGKDEPVLCRGVVVAQSPAGDGENVRSGVVKFDELIFIGVSDSVVVGVSLQTGGRIGEDLVDGDRGR